MKKSLVYTKTGDKGTTGLKSLSLPFSMQTRKVSFVPTAH